MVEDRGTSPASEDGALGYLFEQVRGPRGCPGYVVADPATWLAATVELEMAEPMIVFEYGLRSAYTIGTHTNYVRLWGTKPESQDRRQARLVHKKALSSLVGILLSGGVLTADALLTGSYVRTDLLNGSAVRQYIPSTRPTEASPTTSRSGPATITKAAATPLWATRSRTTPRCSSAPRKSS